MLFEDNEPKGVIVYKKDLQEGSLECKTLSLFNPNRDSGKGYGTVLLNRLMDSASRRSAVRILLTVSSRNPARGFFMNKGFSVIQSIADRYVKGDVEDTLTLDVEEKTVVKQFRSQVPEIRDTFSSASSRPVSFSRVDRDMGTVVQHRSFGSQQSHSFSPDIKCTLKREFIDAIRSGNKTYEGRVATSFFRGYVPGKIVQWYCGERETDRVTTEIVSRDVYRSFEEMLDKVGYKKFLPYVRDVGYAKELYDRIPGYSDKVKIHGALALGLRLVNTTPSADRDRVSSDQQRFGRDKDQDAGRKRLAEGIDSFGAKREKSDLK